MSRAPHDLLLRSPVRLPPLLTSFALRDAGPLREVAPALAAAGALGAGDAIVGMHPGEVALAIVLEPDVAVSVARQMAPLMMVAVAEALGALLPPKVAIEHAWPGEVIVNGGSVGRVGVRIASSPTDAAVPDWMVVDVALDLHGTGGSHEPGERPGTTCLAEEGGADLVSADVVVAIATRFLSWLDRWQSDGFAPVAHAWLFRARGRTEEIDLPLLQPAQRGKVVRLLEDCSLDVLSRTGGEHRLAWPAGAVADTPARRS